MGASLLQHCLFCYTRFPHNQTLEFFPVGRRIAFDPRRGRLWAVCSACERWTLAPFEDRWEVLEALNRLMVDHGRIRIQGENVALISAQDLELIFIGKATLPEEARWRYADQFRNRRARASRILGVGHWVDTIAVGSVLLLSTVALGVPILPIMDTDKWVNLSRRKAFGRLAWSSSNPCDRCGRPLPPRSFDERGGLVIERAPHGMSLWQQCAACGVEDAGHRIQGNRAEHLVRRLLAWENFAGARFETLSDAMSLMTASGSPERFIQDTALQRRLIVGRLPSRVTIALEIAANHAMEQRLLTRQAKELDQRWREEEEIAAIVDRELTE